MTEADKLLKRIDALRGALHQIEGYPGTGEAAQRYFRSIALAALRKDTEAGERMGEYAHTPGAINFFKANARYSPMEGETDGAARVRRATELASAECEAKARGWVVRWKSDREAGITPAGNPRWYAALCATNGKVLASRVGIDPEEGYTACDNADAYARVVAAELAIEALTQ